MKLRSVQRKALSDFLNTIAAAWFTAGVISPLFIQTENIGKTVVLGGLSVTITVIILMLSLNLVRMTKL